MMTAGLDTRKMFSNFISLKPSLDTSVQIDAALGKKTALGPKAAKLLLGQKNPLAITAKRS